MMAIFSRGAGGGSRSAVSTPDRPGMLWSLTTRSTGTSGWARYPFERGLAGLEGRGLVALLAQQPPDQKHQGFVVVDIDHVLARHRGSGRREGRRQWRHRVFTCNARCRQRQVHVKTRALSGAGEQIDGAAVRLDNAVHHSQTQTGSPVGL